MQKIIIIIIAVLLQACSNLEFPGVYKLPIEQGNVVTQEMVDQLKPGMSKSQVEFIMGKPLIKDSFNNHRWDYVYSVKRGNKEREQYRLSLFFSEDDLLSHFTGDFRPTPTEAAPETASTSSPTETADAVSQVIEEASPETAIPEAAAAVASTAEATEAAEPNFSKGYWTQYYAGKETPSKNQELVQHTFGNKAVVQKEGELLKYMVGPYSSYKEALSAQKILAGMGFDDAFVRQP